MAAKVLQHVNKVLQMDEKVVALGHLPYRFPWFYTHVPLK